jgi:hypothetical protein
MSNPPGRQEGVTSHPDDDAPDSERIMHFTHWYAAWPAISRDLAALGVSDQAIYRMSDQLNVLADIVSVTLGLNGKPPPSAPTA